MKINNFDDFYKLYTNIMENIKNEVSQYNWENKAFYSAFISQLYYFVCHSTRMIPFAASKFDQTDEKLFSRCLDHSVEERGHQFMAANDLKNLGYSTETFPLFASTEQLYAYPYHQIANVDAVAMFGISAYMEGLSVSCGKEATNRVVAKHGEKCASFLISHVQDDETHVREALTSMEALPQNRLSVVARTFIGSNNNFNNILRDAAEYSAKV